MYNVKISLLYPCPTVSETYITIYDVKVFLKKSIEPCHEKNCLKLANNATVKAV